MKNGLVITILCAVVVLELTGAPTQQKPRHGSVTPKLTMVAIVDGKAFFVDNTTRRNRTQAQTYCASLGMRLAEITSAAQFAALDQAEVEEWTAPSTWTGGIEATGIQRYAWERSNTSVDSSYIPYYTRLPEVSTYFLIFVKGTNGSYMYNAVANDNFNAVLCETIMGF